MKNKKKDRKIILVLVVALLFMAVGFATYESTLTLGGGEGGSTATMSKLSWDVHYVTSTLSDSNTYTGQDAITTHTLGTDDFTFAVKLGKPGDTYTATWDVVNEGSFDAILKTINMSTLTTEQAKLLTYTIQYDGVTYTETTNNIGKTLAVGASKTITLTLTYKKPEQADLPSSDVPITVTGSFLFQDE